MHPNISNIIQQFSHPLYSIQGFSPSHFEQIKSLLSSHNHPVSESNMKLIIKEMTSEDPNTFYLVVFDQSNNLVGMSNLWYERKYTRSICTLLHIGQIFTSLELTPTQANEIEFLLIDCLTKLGMKLKDCYKSTMHIHQDRSDQYRELNYEKSEVHMTLYHYIKPSQHL